MHARQLQRFLLLVIFLAGIPLLALSQTVPTAKQNRARLREIRKTPEQYGHLLEQALAFSELPEERRKELRKLDRRLYRLPEATRQRLFAVMNRYNRWLACLPEDQRQKILTAPDPQSKLEIIRQIRKQQWIRKLPRIYRDKLDPTAPNALQEKERQELIAELRRKEKAWKAKWKLAFNHWNDLQRHKPLPASLEDFKNSKPPRDREVYTYVMEYLKPMLSTEEWNELKAAEGQWPRFPCTLVKIADRHPLALPGKHGPTKLKQLPPRIQKQFKRLFQKNRPRIPPKMRTWPAFAEYVTKFAEANNVSLRGPYELWPTKFKDLSPPVKLFLNEKLKPLLNNNEVILLRTAEGRWPIYPETIQRLAHKYGLQVPWQTLPGPRTRWDSYRVKNFELIEEW